MSPTCVLEAEALTKVYRGPPMVTALHEASLTIVAGEKISILGPSGAGKSTLLNLIGLLDTATSGSLRLLGDDVGLFRQRDRNRVRATHLGFVFQDNHVLGQRTVTENLVLALAAMRVSTVHRDRLIDDALQKVGLTDRRDSLARLLSGGEKQRLSVARATLGSPSLVLADEPTGNLDDGNAQQVLELFDRQAADGAAVIVITHDQRLSEWSNRSFYLEAGVLRATKMPRIST